MKTEQFEQLKNLVKGRNEWTDKLRELAEDYITDEYFDYDTEIRLTNNLELILAGDIYGNHVREFEFIDGHRRDISFSNVTKIENHYVTIYGTLKGEFFDCDGLTAEQEKELNELINTLINANL